MALLPTASKPSWTPSSSAWCSTANNSPNLCNPFGLGWRERRVKELALMDDLVPLLKKRGTGRDISGLSAYEQ